MHKLIILFCCFIASNGQHLKSMTTKMYIGSQLGTALQTDAQYKTIAAEEFNCVTPGDAMKWFRVEPIKGYFDYTEADKLVNFAKQNNMKVRGHTLIWHDSLPNWVQQLENNTAELEKAFENHITQEVTHFKGKLYAWDVLNEILNDDGTMRNSIWHKNFGQDYVAKALKLAHSIDPNAKLYINDFSVAGKNNKSDGLYNLVKKLKADDVPIHGVGMQTHLFLGKMPNEMKENMKRFSDLGLDVAITELNIWIKLPASADNFKQQAQEYAEVYSNCLAVQRCVGVTVWGFTDKYLTVADYHKGFGEANLWDKNMKPKPAVAAVQHVLK